jgi:hypothetical protein
MSDSCMETQDAPKSDFRRFAWPAGIFLLTLVVVGALARQEVDLHHDGLVFKAALDVAEGRALFRETYTQAVPFIPEDRLRSTVMVNHSAL